ncbi:MAG: exodeoxyribonuclease VII large subunit [Verrucomicrobiae bacterium]|nr:exodeoxyribonuclease VII large subunit [Verrucomicrobiae bacterium]
MPAISRPGSESMLSVTELTREIRESLEGRFGDVWVEGEISNYRPHSSGHHYFTLKDAKAQLSAVMFRGQARSLPMPLRDGMLVQARGDISVYEARGQYQLIARWIQPKGFGELQAKFEALKRQLESEGLFDPARKKPIPTFPRTIALVTSPTGAAIRDMINILSRRAPWLRILVWPVRVQGEGAAKEIAAALNHLADSETDPALPRIDTIIVGRGGGSIEDLWSFNEEIVARAIHACPIPVISAVGHEIDFTISDFVADLRAPTPSAAAELVAPDGAELRRSLEMSAQRLDRTIERALESWRSHLDYHRRSLAQNEPTRVIQDHLQDCDATRDRMEEAVDDRLARLAERVEQLRRILDTKHPGNLLAGESVRLEEWRTRLDRIVEDRQRHLSDELSHARKLLEILSPKSAFQRGFSLTRDAEGKVISRVAQAKAGSKLKTRVADGEFESVVS